MQEDIKNDNNMVGNTERGINTELPAASGTKVLSLAEKRERRRKKRERKEKREAKQANLTVSVAPPTPPITPAPPTLEADITKLERKTRRFLGFLWKLKPKEGEEEHEPNAYVSDFRNGLDFEYIEPNLIPDDSRLRVYNKRQVHVLSRDKEDVLHIVEPPRVIEANESPAEVYTALNCPLVEVVFGVPDTLWNKISHIALYVIMGVDAIMVFLIWGSSLR